MNRVLDEILARIDITGIMVLVASMAGSYGEEYLRLMKSHTPEKLSITNILLSTVIAGILTYSFSDIIIERVGPKVLIFLAFVAGLAGLRLMEQLSTPNGAIKFIKKIIEIFFTGTSISGTSYTAPKRTRKSIKQKEDEQ